MSEQKAVKNYWLFTTNYLQPFKRYYKSKEAALEKLYEQIDVSIPYYKDILKNNAEEEIRDNIQAKKQYEEDKEYQEYLNSKEENLEIEPIKCPKYKKHWQEKYRTFNKFSPSELECSITLLDLSEMEEQHKEKIFYPKGVRL